MKITTEINEADVEDIKQLIERANQSEATSHGALNFETLARMLLEDAAMVVRRPGSWEGAGMAQVLARHGYEV